MAISVIASTSAIAGAVSTHTSSSFDSTGAGLIEVTVAFDVNAATITVADSKGCYWRQLSLTTSVNASVGKFYAYCYPAGLNGSGHTVTVTFNTTAYAVVMVRAYAGNNLTFVTDNGATGFGTSLNGGSVTPIGSQALVTAGLCGAALTGLAISGGSLAIIASHAYAPGVNYGGAYADEIQTTAAARNPAWSWTTAAVFSAKTACYYEAANPPLNRLVLLESWDGYGGDNTQFSRKWTRNSTALSTSHPQAGAYSAGFASGTGPTRVVGLSGSRFVIGFQFWWDGTSQGFTDLMTLSISGTAVCSLDNDSSGALVVARGGDRGTTIATSANVLTTNAQNFIQVFFDSQDSGSYVVQCNGATVLSGSADMNAASGISVPNNLFFGAALTTGWDSVFVIDGASASSLITSSGLSVTMFRPSIGNGANTGLTPSTGTDHGALVDEAIANDDTDYNEGGAGVKDTYIFDTSSLSGRTIYGVMLTIVAKATSAGTNTICAVARVGGVDYDGLTQTISTSYAYYEQPWTNDPTGSAWVAGASMEFGVKSIASAAANRVTAVYLEVLSDGVAVTGAVRLVGPMRIKTRFTGGVLV